MKAAGNTTAPYIVVIRNEQGKRVPFGFYSPAIAKDFARKVKHSKRCSLVFEPLYNK